MKYFANKLLFILFLILSLFFSINPLFALNAGYTSPGGTSYSSTNFQKIASAAGLRSEFEINGGFIDSVNHYAYLLGNKGVVVKIDLNTNPPTHLGQLQLAETEWGVQCAAVDWVNRYAYIGTSGGTGYVIKITVPNDSSLPVRLGALTLPVLENELQAAVYNSGYVWFATSKSPAEIIKVNVTGALPTRVNKVALQSGEDKCYAAAIDTVNNYGYFLTYASPKLVKMDLNTATPTRIGALSLSEGTNGYSIAYDSVRDRIYAGFSDTSKKLAKINPNGSGVPTLIGYTTSTETYFSSIVLDETNNRGYVGARGRLVKFDLGTTSSLPTQLFSISSVTSVNYFQRTSLFDPGQNKIYISVDFDISPFLYIDAGTLNGTPIKLGEFLLNSGHNKFESAGVDGDGYIYFGTGDQTGPGQIVKWKINQGSQAPQMVSWAQSLSNYDDFQAALIDNVNRYGYFGTSDNPAKVVKVRLGTGDSAPSFVGHTTLSTNELNISAGVIDIPRQQALFSTSDLNYNYLVKVRLGSGDSLPVRVGSSYFQRYDAYRAELFPTQGLYFPEHDQVIFSTDSSYAYLATFVMGNSSQEPYRYSSTEAFGDNYYMSMAYDTINKAMIIGSGYNDGYSKEAFLVKWKKDLDTAAIFSWVNKLDTTSTVDHCDVAVADVKGRYAYLASDETPAKIMKVRFNGANDAISIAQTYTLSSSEGPIKTGCFDDRTGRLIFTTYQNPSKVISFRAGQQGYLKGTKITVGELAKINSINYYSHIAMGKIRLAIYDNASTKNRVWESQEINNTATGSWLSIPVSSGIPASLIIEAGTYWITWQIDNNSESPSLITGGASGDGFTYQQIFSESPLTLPSGSITNTSERWAVNLDYDALVPPILDSITAIDRDSANGVKSGWTNEKTIKVQINASGYPADTARVSDNDFISSTTYSIAPEVSFNLTGSSDGVYDIKAQLFNIAGGSSIKSSSITLDTANPKVLSVIPNNGITTNTLNQIQIIFDEAVEGVAAGNLLINGAPASSVSGTLAGPYIFSFTQPSEGSADIVLGGTIHDYAGNLFGGYNGNYIVDINPPVSDATGDYTQVGSPIYIDFNSTDSLSGVSSTSLWVKLPGTSVFTDTGLSLPSTSGTFSFSAAIDGIYQFATVSTDNSGNSETNPPVSADITVTANIDGGTFSQQINGNGIYYFPMTDSLDIIINISGFTMPNIFTVSRNIGNFAPPGLNAEYFADEYLTITGNLNGAIAMLTWNIDPANLSGMTGILNSVLVYEGSSLVGQYTITPGENPIIIPGILSFSDWYAGSNKVSVSDWLNLD